MFQRLFIYQNNNWQIVKSTIYPIGNFIVWVVVVTPNGIGWVVASYFLLFYGWWCLRKSASCPPPCGFKWNSPWLFLHFFIEDTVFDTSINGSNFTQKYFHFQFSNHCQPLADQYWQAVNCLEPDEMVCTGSALFVIIFCIQAEIIVQN